MYWMSHKMAIFFNTLVFNTYPFNSSREIFSDFYSILCMKNISWNCWNIYLKCDLRIFLATIQFVTKTLASGVRGKVNIEYVMLLPKQSESLFSCLQGRRTADIFVATKWANPQCSEYEYMLVQYSIVLSEYSNHFRF